MEGLSNTLTIWTLLEIRILLQDIRDFLNERHSVLKQAESIIILGVGAVDLSNKKFPGEGAAKNVAPFMEAYHNVIDFVTSKYTQATSIFTSDPIPKSSPQFLNHTCRWFENSFKQHNSKHHHISLIKRFRVRILWGLRGVHGPN